MHLIYTCFTRQTALRAALDGGAARLSARLGAAERARAASVAALATEEASARYFTRALHLMYTRFAPGARVLTDVRSRFGERREPSLI